MKYRTLLLALLGSLGLSAQFNTPDFDHNQHNFSFTAGTLFADESFGIGIGYEFLVRRRAESKWTLGVSVNFDYFDLPDDDFLTFGPAIGASARFLALWDLSQGEGHHMEFQIGPLVGRFLEQEAETGGFAGLIGYRYQLHDSPLALRAGIGGPYGFYVGLAARIGN